MNEDSIRQRFEDSRREARDREARFLTAWTMGITLAGPEYFELPPGGLDAVTDREQARPDWERIERAIGSLSSGEGAFLAAMYSFFNVTDGQRLLERAGYPNIAELGGKLDAKRAEVIAALFLNHTGW